ncbi:MAG: wbfB protein [Deltaproteobacteria bacterium]|nr:wbfB protein [Deltaproteobacteria bacterium]
MTPFRARIPGVGGMPSARFRCRIGAAAALLAALFLTGLPAVPSRAGDEPFTYPSNSGLTGLLETPTARVMKENRYRLGVTQVEPYRFYYGTVGLFERIEVNGRVTQVLDVPGFPDIPGSSYGDFKDRAVEAKFQLVKEGKYFPALSVVISDPSGTRVYASQSVVASKQVFPFDFSLGMGNGRYGTKPLPTQEQGIQVELITDPSSWWRDAQVFGGVQFAPVDWLALVAEYSPIRYDRQTQDPAQPKYFPKPVPSKINAGLRLKPTRWSEIDVSWQRGEELGVSASLSFDIGKPILPIHYPPYREPEATRTHPLAARISTALRATGFRDIGVEGDDFTLRVDAENDRYFFTPTAVGALLDAIAPIIPPGYDSLRVRLKENGIPVAEFTTRIPYLEEMRDGRIPKGRFYDLSAFRTEGIGDPIPETTGRRWFDYGIAPSFEMFLNDPSRYFSYRLGISAFLHAFPWKGGMAVLGAEAYPLNTVTTTNAPLSIPVRSDIALYKDESVSLGRLLFQQIVKAERPIYARAAAGLLEVEYAGLDGEVALPLYGGRLIADASGSLVRKRDPDNPFAFANDTWYWTTFLTTRLNVPEADCWFDVKGGRFLAGDWGARFTLSKFIRGVTLSAWYTVTDTSVFSDPYNSGYRDKGFSVSIPIRLFLGRDSRTTYQFSMSPWTRDVGQDVDHYRTLLDFIGRNTDILLDKDVDTLYKGAR